MVALIVFEITIKDITIEKCKFAFNFLIIFPTTTEDCTLAEKVVALSMLFSLEELSYVLVLVRILEIAHTVRELISVLAGIYAAILVNHTAFTLLNALKVFSNVDEMIEFIFLITISMFHTFFPLTFVIFFWRVKNPNTMLYIILPRTGIKCGCILVIISTSAIFFGLFKKSIIDFPCRKDINTLSIKKIIFPTTKIHISIWIQEDSLPMFNTLQFIIDISSLFTDHLSNVFSLIWKIHFYIIIQSPYSFNVFLFSLLINDKNRLLTHLSWFMIK